MRFGDPTEPADADLATDSHRARFARRLLELTDLPAAIVAEAIGAESTAALDALLTRIFAFDAAGLRKRRLASERRAAATLDGGVMWTESFWQPNDISGTLGYLASRGIPGVVEVTDGRYRRIVRTSAGDAIAEVSVDTPANDDVGRLRLRLAAEVVPAGPGELLALSDAVRRLFSLDSPPPGSIDALTADPVLGPHVQAEPGRRLAGAWDRFETAIRIIIGQQVTVAAASTLTGRVVERCRDDTLDHQLDHQVSKGLIAPFPSAAEVAAADLVDIGMPGSRVATIQRFATAIATGDLDLDAAPTVADLCTVKGIGPWTAELIAARVLGKPDAFPPKDLGLVRAYEAMGGAEPVEAAAERWRPHRASSIPYLWARA